MQLGLHHPQTIIMRRSAFVLLLAVPFALGSFRPLPRPESPQGYALLIATNSINPASIKQKRFTRDRPAPQYGSTEFVANDIAVTKAMLAQSAFETNHINELVGDRIAGDAVRQALTDLSAKAKSGDLVFIYFTGHGEQLPDTNGDEEDSLDEAMVLYDDLVVDDEVAALLNRFAAGVRCVFVVDACHSGSTNKFMKAGTKRFMVKSSKNFFEGDIKGQSVAQKAGACPYFRVNPDSPKMVIYLGASADNQQAKGTSIGSYFTSALWSFFKDGDGSWRAFNYRTAFCELTSRVAALTNDQTVHYEEDGKADFATNDYLLKINQ